MMADELPVLKSFGLDHHRILMEKVGCIAPWVSNSTRICKYEEEAARANKLMMDSSLLKGQCLNPCNFLIINVGAKNFQVEKAENTGLMYFYFAPRVMLR